MNLDKNDQPVLECMRHMKLRLKTEGAGKGAYRNPEDCLVGAPSREPSLKHAPKPPNKNQRVPSRSDSSELEDGGVDIPSLTKQLNAVKPVNLFNRRRKSTDSHEPGLWKSVHSRSDDDGGSAGRSRLSLPEL